MKSETFISARVTENEATRSGRTNSVCAFTVLELLVVLVTLGLLAITLAPAFARSGHNGEAFQCLNNHRQLVNAWRQWSVDNNDYLVTCEGTKGAPAVGPSWETRPNWMSGAIDYNPGNPSNYDPAQDILRGPLWPYTLKSSLYRCPADRSTILLGSPWNGYPAGTRISRLRSYSMSQVFANGEWLDGTFSPSSARWRVYAKGSEIAIPARTFLFIEEHPGSINDGAFACACSSNQSSDPPSSATMIDMPSNWHLGGCAISFADNHVEIHKWRSPYLKNLNNDDGYVPPLNINIGALDPLGYLDARWLAARTTVAR